MGAISWIHWLIIGIALFILGFPAARILKRAGFSPWWCLIAALPYVNIIGLWVFAFVKWPALERTKG